MKSSIQMKTNKRLTLVINQPRVKSLIKKRKILNNKYLQQLLITKQIKNRNKVLNDFLLFIYIIFVYMH